MIDELCPLGGAVLDPFVGRGTTIFAARNSGRTGLGCDVSPIAWLWTATKCDPEPDMMRLVDRLADIEAGIHDVDTQPENEFQALCWSPRVLGFLRSARRCLDWRGSRADRTLMAIILLYIHAKSGYGLSNQMSGSRPTSPEYSIRWWSSRGMKPPEIDPVDFLICKIQYRYRHGIPCGKPCDIRLGPAQDVLPDPATTDERFDLLITSPPYLGVTNYRLDNWIRLWMLGDNALPDLGDTAQKYAEKRPYIAMLDAVLHRAAGLLKPEASILIRTDSRAWTRNVTAALIAEIWTDRPIFYRSEIPERGKTQTVLLNSAVDCPGETDFLICAGGPLNGFKEIKNCVPRAGLDAILAV